MQNILSYFIRVRHKLAHRIGWNHGVVDSWTEKGKYFVGFRCTGCGMILDATQFYPPNKEMDDLRALADLAIDKEIKP